MSLTQRGAGESAKRSAKIRRASATERVKTEERINATDRNPTLSSCCAMKTSQSVVQTGNMFWSDLPTCHLYLELCNLE